MTRTYTKTAKWKADRIRRGQHIKSPLVFQTYPDTKTRRDRLSAPMSKGERRIINFLIFITGAVVSIALLEGAILGIILNLQP